MKFDIACPVCDGPSWRQIEVVSMRRTMVITPGALRGSEDYGDINEAVLLEVWKCADCETEADEDLAERLDEALEFITDWNTTGLPES